MALKNSLIRVLHTPNVEGLWELRGDLFELGLPEQSRVWPVVENFHAFLEQVSQVATSREYSHLASLLDIGAIGGVVIEDLLHAEDARDLAERLLGAVISESLMVLATRQHVKAWDAEMASTFRSTAWFLYGQLWHLSSELKPGLPVVNRREMIEKLLAPVRSAETGDLVRIVVIGRLFQLLLVGTIAREWNKLT